MVEMTPAEAFFSSLTPLLSGFPGSLTPPPLLQEFPESHPSGGGGEVDFFLGQPIVNTCLMSEADITPIPKIFRCQSIFLQTGTSKGSTEPQSIGIRDVHNFIQY